MKIKEPVNDTGMVTNGISVAEGERRNTKVTATTSTRACHRVSNTARMDPSMDKEVSKATRSSMPGGKEAAIAGNSAFTAWATARVLAVDCLTTPSPTAG